MDSFWFAKNDNRFFIFSDAFPGLHIRISNVSTYSHDRATFGFSQNTKTQQRNVEVLRKILGKVCLKEKSNVKHSSFLTSQTSLNCAAGPFSQNMPINATRSLLFQMG